jgi:hypothetical protein
MYASPGWAARRHLGSPRLLAPALRWLLLGPRSGPEAVRITVESVAECRPLTVSGFRPTLEAHERDAALAVFAHIPTVVLVGTKDRLTPVRLSRRIASALPSASLSIFPEAGHMLPVERVAGVAGRIGALVKGAVPAGRCPGDVPLPQAPGAAARGPPTGGRRQSWTSGKPASPRHARLDISATASSRGTSWSESSQY